MAEIEMLRVPEQVGLFPPDCPSAVVGQFRCLAGSTTRVVSFCVLLDGVKMTEAERVGLRGSPARGTADRGWDRDGRDWKICHGLNLTVSGVNEHGKGCQNGTRTSFGDSSAQRW